MLQGVILDQDTLGTDTLDWSALETLPVIWTRYHLTTAEQVAGRICDADIVITNKAPIGHRELLTASKLKLISVIATGVNVVDTDAARAKHITLCNCIRYGTASVAQHTFSLILALTTSLLAYHKSATDGSWARSASFCLMHHPVSELAGKTLGIIGYGELGQKVAHIARAFDMKVMVAQLPHRPVDNLKSIERTPLEKLLPQVDVLTIHCPLTNDTGNLIGKTELQQMKKTALVINTARGGIINEQALANALSCGDIAGAGVDVLSEEPPKKGNPLLDPNVPNLIITPHSAWISREARQRLIEQTADNIRQFLTGTPQNQVNG